jgi:hypothetical protein
MTQDFGEEDKREITVSFSFTVEAWLYKPIRETTIIDEIVTKLGVNGDKNYWSEKMQGNYDGSFVSRHDFNYQFGTKIGRVSAMLPFTEQPAPISSLSGWFYEYKYQELPDITNYPAGSKLLLTKTIRNDETSAAWDSICQDLAPLSSTAPVSWVDYTNNPFARSGPFTKYWQVTANSGNGLNGKIEPSVSGDKIYQIYYDPNYVVKEGKIQNGKVVESATFGGTFVLEYKNLQGFGNFSDNLFFGTKDAEINEEVVKNAPWVSQVSTENNEII